MHSLYYWETLSGIIKQSFQNSLRSSEIRNLLLFFGAKVGFLDFFAF